MVGTEVVGSDPGEGVAYGLRLRGVDVGALLSANGRPWPVVEVRQAGGTIPAGEPWLSDSDALLELDGTRRLHVRRTPGQATFHGPPLAPDDLVHPYLGAVAITFGRWLGRETFHAGALVVAGGAWALVGPREAGKSSLLAALSGRGVAVLSDDVLVVDGVDAFAGPRTLDLRTPPPAALAIATAAHSARRGTRWRVPLGDVPVSVPLRGWIFLRWSETVELEPVPAATLLARLASWRSRPELPSDPADVLELAALAAWDLHRPRRWDALEDTMATLAAAVGSLDG